MPLRGDVVWTNPGILHTGWMVPGRAIDAHPLRGDVASPLSFRRRGHDAKRRSVRLDRGLQVVLAQWGSIQMPMSTRPST